MMKKLPLILLLLILFVVGILQLDNVSTLTTDKGKNKMANPQQNYQMAANPISAFSTGTVGSVLAGDPIYQNQIDPVQSGLGTNTYSAPTPAPDPYAKWGGQTAYNTLKSGFDTQKQNIYGSANDAASALQGGYGQSIQDTIHNLTTGQQAIDRKNVQNESSKIQGGRSILDMVGRGIKSGGVMLANKNAGNSSAAGALANAYGQMGRRQMSSIGNQYAQNASDIAVSQAEQDYQTANAPGKFHEQLMGNVNSIVADARNQFAQLDAAMANASLPDRIAIEQEKENVRQQVLGKLQQYDAQLASGVGGIHAASQDQNRATANSQLQAGQADPNLFQYQTEAPIQLQGGAPAGGNLPIYTFPRGTKQYA